MEDGLHVIKDTEPVSSMSLRVPTIAIMEVKGNVALANLGADSLLDGTWWLARLFVREGHRGKGLGGKLLERVKEELSEVEGFEVLEVAPGGYGTDVNVLIRFYEKHGFVKGTRGTWEWRKE